MKLFDRLFGIAKKGDNTKLQKNMSLDSFTVADRKEDDLDNLSKNFNDMDFDAVIVNGIPCGIDLTLGIEEKPNSEYLSNPSEAIAFFAKVNRNVPELSIEAFFTLQVEAIMTCQSMVYKKGEFLEFTTRFFPLTNIKPNSNRELTLVSSIEDNDSKSYYDYLQGKEKRSYKLGLLPGQESKIITQDLGIGEQELLELSAFYQKVKKDPSFSLSVSQFKELNSRIKFIGVIDDVLVVKGKEKSEDTIYTTLKEDELTVGMKALPRKEIEMSEQYQRK